MNNYLPTDYQAFIHTSRYARWIEEEGRRETWSETVSRYINNVVAPKVDAETAQELEEAILGLEVMPSMRAMMTAGTALERDNVAGYNCSFTPIDHVRTFDEVLYILLNGTGVGFSCEAKYTDSLPNVPRIISHRDVTIGVEDSKEGWADAYRQLIEELYDGTIPKWDVSGVRPAGARLMTFGGRASGPEPLVDLFRFTVDTFIKAQGRKLKPIEVHSIMCMIGQIVVVGGVRRSAMISLSDLTDEDMRDAKSGEWWIDNGHYALANNSVAYDGKPDAVTFMREWTALAASGSGERGIFNRKAASDKAMREGIRATNYEFGTNPCSEIVLRSSRLEKTKNLETGEYELMPVVGTGGQFCNLTEAVIRDTDTMDAICRKVRLASILGTIQATMTHFPYLRDCWKHNTEEEALLGVSLTGIMDNALTNGKKGNLENRLQLFRRIAVDTNEQWARKLGINKAAAVTAVKPSGTVSQLCSSASGIHARHSEYYIRTVRGDNKDPLTQFMTDQGIPSEPCVMKPDNTTVFSFPQSAVGSITRNDMGAVEQLEMWLMYQRHYTCHKPSVTVSVGEDEWPEVGAFVYKHFDEMSGVSFLPRFDHTYAQAPYQDCTKEEYAAALAVMPTRIDWSKLSDYEKEDGTKASQTLACTGGVCEIVDISA
jgi:ribonucleoside-diphosphate reductase alpha chain